VPPKLFCHSITGAWLKEIHTRQRTRIVKISFMFAGLLSFGNIYQGTCFRGEDNIAQDMYLKTCKDLVVLRSQLSIALSKHNTALSFSHGRRNHMVFTKYSIPRKQREQNKTHQRGTDL